MGNIIARRHYNHDELFDYFFVKMHIFDPKKVIRKIVHANIVVKNEIATSIEIVKIEDTNLIDRDPAINKNWYELVNIPSKFIDTAHRIMQRYSRIAKLTSSHRTGYLDIENPEIVVFLVFITAMNICIPDIEHKDRCLAERNIMRILYKASDCGIYNLIKYTYQKYIEYIPEEVITKLNLHGNVLIDAELYNSIGIDKKRPVILS